MASTSGGEVDNRNALYGDDVPLCGANKTGGAGKCKQAAGHGTDHVGIGRCKFHGGNTSAHKTAAKAEMKRRGMFYGEPVDIQKIIDHLDDLIERQLEIALSATRTVVVPGTKDSPGYTEEVPDEALQAKAIQDILDRVVGRARQTVEVGGVPGGDPVQVEIPAERERVGKVAAILETAGKIPNTNATGDKA